MKMKIFSVYDSKAGAYLQPFFFNHTGGALRAFSDLCSDVQHTFGKHPEDYTLFELGTYEDDKSSFDIYDTPRSLGVGIELISNGDS